MPRPEADRSREIRNWWSKAWVALIEDRREYAEIVEEIFREREGLSDTVIHQFTTCESFLEAENLEDYDICLVDGDFGYGNMKGFEAVSQIKAQKPNMLIVGLTDQPEYLQAFEQSQANLALKKKDLIRLFPRLLSLAPSEGEQE